MSTTMENNVVEMRFENEKFAVNVQSSMTMIQDLKDSLELTDASKGLQNVGTAVSVIDMTGLNTQVEVLQVSFSVLDEVAVTALTNISDSILLVIETMNQMGELDGGVLLGFAAFAVISKFVSSDAVKAGEVLVSMSGTLLNLASAMETLGKMKAGGLMKALGAVTAIGLIFGALIVATKYAQNCKDTLGTLKDTIVVLANTLVALAVLDPKGVATAAASLSSVIAMFALLVAATKLAENVNSTLLIMAGIVAGIGLMLFGLASLPFGSTLEAAQALSLLLLSFTASMLILSKIQMVSPAALTALVAMTAVVAALALIIDFLSATDVGSTLEIAQSLSLLLTALSGACVILSVVGQFGGAAITGIGILAVLITAVGILIGGIGALAVNFPQMEEFLNKGIPILEQIGYGLGSFFGNILGGFAAGATSGLPELGNNLSSFITNLDPFLKGIKSIDEDAINGVKALTETILLLTAADIMSGLTACFGGDSSLTAFGDELAAFGPKMAAFVGSVSNVTPEAITAAANAAKTLAEFASVIPNTGGLLAGIVGDNSLSVFGEELVAFGPKFAEFAESVGNVTPEKITAAANAAKVLAEFASAIPNTGGLLANLVGENSISAFGDELVAFGPKIKQFATDVTGLAVDAVTNSTIAAQALAEMANNLPNSGGILASWVGDNKLSTFAEELKTFGPSLKTYADEVTGLSTDVVTNSTNAALALSAMADTLPNTGGVVSWFTGDNDMAAFGESLVEFGKYFAEYSGYMEEVTADVVNTTTNAASALVELANSLPEEDGIFSDVVTLSEFGKEMVKFGEKFSSFYTSISGVDTTQLSGVILQLASLLLLAQDMSELNTEGMISFGDALNQLGQTGVTDFITAFTDSFELVTTAIYGMMDYVILAFTTKQPEYILSLTTLMTTLMTALIQTIIDILVLNYLVLHLCGQSLMTNLIAGIVLQSLFLKSAFILPISGALTAIRNKYTDFYNAGVYLVQGFINGIADKIEAAAAKAAEMAAAASEAANSALDINSPSRVTYQIGASFGEGFTNALSDYGDNAYKAGSEMVTMAKNGLNNAIARVADWISTDIETEPTIRPVLDLTKVEAGASRLKTLFSHSQVASINTDMLNRSGANGQFQGGETASTSGNTYQFTQNNYSPKELSRLEIYRQTQNQFAMLKGAVES